jgi:ubiquinone/menaquinone biosynthesis C-methylase UbiE
MAESRAWNWQSLKSDNEWEEPSEQIHYLTWRWRGKGLGRVLDLGCGLGRHSLFLAESGFEVDAFDLAAEAVGQLREKSQQRGLALSVKHGDMLDLPYPDAVFDYLVAYHVIYHSDCAGVERVISEIHRVLKPGAEIYVTDTEVRRLLSGFRLIRLNHMEEIAVEGDGRGWHYFVLAEKPA